MGPQPRLRSCCCWGFLGGDFPEWLVFCCLLLLSFVAFGCRCLFLLLLWLLLLLLSLLLSSLLLLLLLILLLSLATSSIPRGFTFEPSSTALVFVVFIILPATSPLLYGFSLG